MILFTAKRAGLMWPRLFSAATYPATKIPATKISGVRSTACWTGSHTHVTKRVIATGPRPGAGGTARTGLEGATLKRTFSSGRLARKQLASGETMSTAIVEAKRAAGHTAIDEHLRPEYTRIGIGSGSTVVFCVERIEQLVKQGTLDVSRMVFVPTGFQSKQLIRSANLPLAEVDQFGVGELDIVFDGADEIDSALNCIKGGGACQFQEKLVGHCARKFIVVADSSKESTRLGQKWRQGVPLEVLPPAVKKVTGELEKLGAKKVTLRLGGKAKAGPIITDNGNFILDTDFGELEPSAVTGLDKKIKLLVGVVETGLFDYAEEAYIGNADGTFKVLKRSS